MSTNDLPGLLALIEERAPRLRTAGVQSLIVGGVTMVLAPADPPQAVDIVEDDQPRSLMDDPEAYGLPPDADVPGFQRPNDLRKA
jgi:hypothetical protein